jgi:hypothetical protein
MSCLGPKYNPNPTREWFRFQNVCAYNNSPINYQKAEAYKSAVLKKGNILQFKKNSANITKQQRYAQIARGMWTNRTTSWATQTQTYTNPNTGSLKREGYINININNPTPLLNLTGRRQNDVNNGAFFSYQETFKEITCPVKNNIVPVYNALPPTNDYIIADIPFFPLVIPPLYLPPITSDKSIEIPQVVPSIGSTNSDVIVNQTPVPETIIIPDGGSLNCNISENICTGQIYRTGTGKPCNPTSDSDVPGPIVPLCYDDSLPTYYPRERRTFSAGGNKWPQGEKLIFSANSIKPVN